MVPNLAQTCVHFRFNKIMSNGTLLAMIQVIAPED